MFRKNKFKFSFLSRETLSQIRLNISYLDESLRRLSDESYEDYSDNSGLNSTPTSHPLVTYYNNIVKMSTPILQKVATNYHTLGIEFPYRESIN